MGTNVTLVRLERTNVTLGPNNMAHEITWLTV